MVQRLEFGARSFDESFQNVSKQAASMREPLKDLDVRDAWPLADILQLNDAERLERLLQAKQLATPQIWRRLDLAAFTGED